jgi:hypothetical protein
MMLVYRLPGPMTIEIGLVDGAIGVLAGGNVVGRQPDPVDLGRFRDLRLAGDLERPIEQRARGA